MYTFFYLHLRTHLSPGWVKPKTIELVLSASSRSTKYIALRSKCKDGLAQNQDNVSCLPVDCYFSELSL